MNLKWQLRRFEDFDLTSFHDLIQLRIEVFVIEQECPYQELDGLDKLAWHLTAETAGGEIIACSRILPKGTTYNEYPSFGRVLVKLNHRGGDVGHEVVRRSIQCVVEKYNDSELKISAQEYLENFYEKHNFLRKGASYLEDGIPHIPMILNIT